MEQKPPKRPLVQNDRIQVVASDRFRARVDNWRRKQDKIPSLSEAIRTLAEMTLDRLEDSGD